MSVIVPNPEDQAASTRALAAHMAAAMFDNDGHSPAIRKATREWLQEQQKNPQRWSWSGRFLVAWLLFFIAVGALACVSW